MVNQFRFGNYIVRRDGDAVQVMDLTGAVLSTHGLGQTTITGTSGPLTANQRREVREYIAELDAALEIGI